MVALYASPCLIWHYIPRVTIIGVKILYHQGYNTISLGVYYYSYQFHNNNIWFDQLLWNSKLFYNVFWLFSLKTFFNLCIFSFLNEKNNRCQNYDFLLWTEINTHLDFKINNTFRLGIITRRCDSRPTTTTTSTRRSTTLLAAVASTRETKVSRLKRLHGTNITKLRYYKTYEVIIIQMSTPMYLLLLLLVPDLSLRYNGVPRAKHGIFIHYIYFFNHENLRNYYEEASALKGLCDKIIIDITLGKYSELLCSALDVIPLEAPPLAE